MTIKYLYPVQDADIEQASMADRLKTLDGMILGLLPNAKENSNRLHELIGKEISKKFKLAGIKVMHKGHAGTNCDPGIMQEMAKEADAVITGLGD
ncbi:MAG: hypothetical protein V3V52_02650 [Candidatus Adiutricales bacterium]